ncbi:protein trichome birefringence-like 35 [Phalaenopsis equestris]|uniref:protein trichome birefringence-like 35 n=1 Tax=Phalaenopsis equestris TaxID=78828 RepID=UPI0009E495CF|nr:protein trichome birefringence-like 35 [Phalaenopsis equestris]
MRQVLVANFWAKWNGSDMLEKLRDKRLMFVGDSLNRGQWISMVCLLQSMLPSGKKSMSPNAPLTIFTAEEYNATVEFYWAPLIVESNSDDPVNHRLDYRIIRPNSLFKHASQWKNADILVFNSYLWWRSGPKIKLLWNADDEICEEADGLDAMALALETWADWISSSVNPLKQRVFFVTMSPTHLWSRSVETFRELWNSAFSSLTNIGRLTSYASEVLVCNMVFFSVNLEPFKTFHGMVLKDQEVDLEKVIDNIEMHDGLYLVKRK